MKRYASKSVVIRKETLVGVRCDICKRGIKDGEYYYDVRTGHNEWGVDSIDSDEDGVVCSDECLRKEVEIFIKGRASSKYMNVSKERVSFETWEEDSDD